MIAREIRQAPAIRRPRTLRIVLVAGAAIAAIVLAATALFQAQSALPIESTTASAEIVRYDTLEEMVATSTAVVEGEVTAIKVLSERKLDEQVLTTYAVTLAVKDALRGEPGSTVTMIENGALATPSKVGDRGFYFLLPRGDIPGLRLASSQARYRIGSDGRLYGSNPDDDLVRGLQSNSIERFRQTVRAAVVTVDRDHVSPKPMPGGAGSGKG